MSIVIDGIVSATKWIGKKAIKVGKKGFPIAKKGVESLGEWISNHISDKRIDLKPINISLIAPSGFGKTTLISTIMKEMDLTLQKTDKGRTFELDVRPKEKDDDKRLEENNRAIIEAITSGNGRITSVSIAGTGQLASYNYEIALSMQDNKRELVQPFCMMDIPGGWINSNNRSGIETQKQWENFEKHLHESRILWIPIDSVALMEARTSNEMALRAKLMDIADVSVLAGEWAKYRVDDDESCICFIPLKCETYKLLSENKEDSFVKEEFYKKFKEMFDNVMHEVSRIKGEGAKIKLYYTPVETIGCIEKIASKWGLNNEKVEFSADYTITGSARHIKGADLLLNKVYEYANNQINEMAKYDEQLLKADSFMDKKKAKMSLNTIKKAIKPLTDEFSKHVLDAKKLEEIYVQA